MKEIPYGLNGPKSVPLSLTVYRAKITLTNLKTKKSQTAKTDEFGDFWFEGLDVGEYSLKVENDGYYTQKIESIKTEKDVNVGDIKLYKKAQVAS